MLTPTSARPFVHRAARCCLIAELTIPRATGYVGFEPSLNSVIVANEGTDTSKL